MAVSLDQINTIQPGDNSEVATALTFLRLVVQNNPNRSARELLERPDVQSALGTVDTWLSQAEQLAEAVIKQTDLIPAEAAEQVLREVKDTLSGFRRETRVNDANMRLWRQDDQYQGWLARMLLRMGWFVRFLVGLVGGVAGGATKTWVSRLASNTCVYCRNLHGVTVGISESFASAAKAAGWTRIYGGLFAPPLHPNCQCHLVFG